MYIYDFLMSLDLFQKDKLPNIERFFKNAIYYGINTKDELKEREISYNGDDQNYLVYSLGKNTHKLYSIGIDQELNYIQELTKEPLKIPRASMIYVDTAIFEAIRLYDELTRYPDSQAFFDFTLNYDIQLMTSLYQDNHFEYKPALVYFHNNPIERDIAQAQFVYFIKKYAQHRLKNAKAKGTYIYHNFDAVLKNTLLSYDAVQERGYKVSEYTHIPNEEFDDFLQQIFYLPHYMKEE